MTKPDYGFWQVVFAIMAIIFAVIAIIIAYYCLVATVGSHPQEPTASSTSEKIPAQISTPTPPPEIKITPPLNYKVNLLEDIHGTAKNIQEGDEIWVFVYSYSDSNNYYLIGENVTLHNKRWSINRQIGTDDENGAQFDIVAVLADKVAQDKYNYYFKEKGVTAMPNVTDVVEVYDQITVTRKYSDTNNLDPTTDNSDYNTQVIVAIIGTIGLIVVAIISSLIGRAKS